MSSDEEKDYRRRLGEVVSINVTKLNDIQFGYKVTRSITDDKPLKFDLQTTNDNQVLKVV
jgi:hypothetical protein